jgi:hypothetical protein
VNSLVLKYLNDDKAEVEVLDEFNQELFLGKVQHLQEFLVIGKHAEKAMGRKISVFVNGEVNTIISMNCSHSIGPGSVYGDFQVVSGSSINGGPLCPVENQVECGCEGKVSTLTLKNHGPSGHIKVLQMFSQGEWVAIFQGDVAENESFSFNGVDRKATLGNEIKIYLNGIFRQLIHTSCAQAIGIGSRFGDFEVISGSSLIGGSLCSAGEIQEMTCSCIGKVTYLTLQNNGEAGIVKVLKTSGQGLIFESFVSKGGIFSISGLDSRNLLGNEIKIYVNSIYKVSIDTSCTKPIGIGSIFEDFSVVAGASKLGGDFCLIRN